MTEIKTEAGTIERLRNTLRLSHHFWLVAAEEALQGDLGKLRRHVAMSKGQTREDVIAEMGSLLTRIKSERDGI